MTPWTLKVQISSWFDFFLRRLSFYEKSGFRVHWTIMLIGETYGIMTSPWEWENKLQHVWHKIKKDKKMVALCETLQTWTGFVLIIAFCWHFSHLYFPQAGNHFILPALAIVMFWLGGIETYSGGLFVEQTDTLVSICYFSFASLMAACEITRTATPISTFPKFKLILKKWASGR